MDKDPREILMKLYCSMDDAFTWRNVRFAIESKEEWLEWSKKIPYLQFPAHWQIAVIPPFAGAVSRFLIRTEKCPPEERISVYLDCFQVLGWYSEPYWEIYPVDGDTYRCPLDDTFNLLLNIQIALDHLERGS